jgi:hypothetical protein
MRKEMTLSLIVILCMFSTIVAAQGASYSSYIENQAKITWSVQEITNFTMWYTGGGYCAATNNSDMTFQVTSVDDEVSGILSIGNVSVATNDTMIALDLTLGVWPSWLPGLVIEIGQSNIDALNESAYAATERVAGNWMNGTMTSHYENISVGNTIHECIVFDYQQDAPGTQVTHLAYSLASGELVEANTSVTFASTYKLVVSLYSVDIPTIADMTASPGTIIVYAGIIGGVALAIIVIGLRLRKS